MGFNLDAALLQRYKFALSELKYRQIVSPIKIHRALKQATLQVAQ